MKRFLTIAALGMIALCTSTVHSQSRDHGVRRMLLDDGATGVLTMSYAGPGSGTMIIPNGGGSLTPTGSITNSTLRWNGTNWVQNSLLQGLSDGGVTMTRTTTGNAGPYYGLDLAHTNTNGGTISNTAVFGIRSTATQGAGGDDEAVAGWFIANGSGIGGNAVGGRFQASGGVGNIGVEVISGGINNTGGIDNNSGGITEAGAISGATTIAATSVAATSATLSQLNITTGAGDRFAGIITTDDALLDAIETFTNTLITASSIVTVTLSTDLGATYILNAVPSAGTLTVKFSTFVANGAKLSYVIVNP